MKRTLVKAILVFGLVVQITMITYALLVREATPTFSGESSEQQQFQAEDDDDRLKKDFEQLRDRVIAKDLTGLLELMRDVGNRWKLRPAAKFLLISDICKSLNSDNFGDPKHTIHARQCAKEVLDHQDVISIDLQMDMVKILQEIEEYRLGQLSHDLWKKDRNERVRYLLQLVRRIDRNFDPNFDFKDLRNIPVGNVCVPAPNYSCGIRPEDVRDPDIRAKYIAAISKNTSKAHKFNAQKQLHRIVGSLPAFVDRFIIGMYTQPPTDQTELKNVLDSFGIVKQRKENLLKAVRSEQKIR